MLENRCGAENQTVMFLWAFPLLPKHWTVGTTTLASILILDSEKWTDIFFYMEQYLYVIVEKENRHVLNPQICKLKWAHIKSGITSTSLLIVLVSNI